MSEYKKFLHWKGHWALEEAAQGSAWVSMPGATKRCVDVTLEDMV